MVAVAGVIVTEATGTGVTVIVEGPLLPSLVAVIVAVPAALPVTSPLAVTVATAVLLLPQLTVRPDNGLPLASFGVAVSCTVWPTCTDAVLGLTVTDATGTVLTVIVAVPLCPSLVAVMVAAPAVTPVASPLPLTVATAGLLLAHLPRPLRRAPPYRCPPHVAHQQRRLPALPLARRREPRRTHRHARRLPGAVHRCHRGVAAGPGHGPPPQRIAERIPRNRRILRRLPHPNRGRRRRHAHRRDRQRAPGHRDARRRGDVPRVA